MTVKLEYVFDTVCPWCYLGKRRLEAALARRPDCVFDLVWRPFLLNPDIPSEGISRQTYLERKFGGSVRIQRIHASVIAAAQPIGLEFDFDAIGRMPNTLASHRLIRYASRFGDPGDMVERLFSAYFQQGMDIGDLDQLVQLAVSAGLPGRDVQAYLHSDADHASVMGENARSHRLGINGVPCVIVDGTYALAGAQEPDILLKLIDVARESQSLASESVRTV